MRSLVVGSILLSALPAFAQGMGTGSCTGGMLAGVVGLAKPDTQSIQAASVPFAYSGADCACSGNTMGDQELLLDIQLTSAFPMGTIGTSELWFGSGCDTNVTARTTQGSTICQKVQTAVNFSTFVTGATSTHIFIPVDALALFSPTTNVCPTVQASNGIFLLFFSGPMASTSGPPYAQCVLNLTEQVQGPGAPTNLGASGGDGAVSLTWSAPSSTLPQPQFYQVLCADADGNPIDSSPPLNIYSTCTPDGLQRRDLPLGGSLGLGDGGIPTASFDTAAVPGGGPPGPAPQAPGDDGGVTDGGTPIGTSLPAPFTFLDRKFVCSEQIPIGTGGGSVRIGGLTNSKSYQFVVVGVDNYGNPTPNDNGVVSATPQPVEDLYRRFRDSGGTASGFCFIATAAYGSYEHRYVRVLRQFRDVVLLPTRAGASFVEWYYAHSPRAAGYIAEHRTARVATQIALWPVIGLAALWLYMPGWLKLLWCLALAGWLVGRRRWRAAR